MAETTKNESNIYTKLLAFQKLGIKIERSSTNPAFKSKYADLSEVLGKVQPALTECGIVLMQIPSATKLRTILRDAANESWIECTLPLLDVSTPQRLGSSITYARRYALTSMLGLGDEDDDGNTASAPTPAPVAKAVPQLTTDQAFAILRKSDNLEELKTAFMMLPKELQKDPEVIALKDELKTILTEL